MNISQLEMKSLTKANDRLANESLTTPTKNYDGENEDEPMSASLRPSLPLFLLNEPYESFEFVPNSLQFYYPK